MQVMCLSNFLKKKNLGHPVGGEGEEYDEEEEGEEESVDRDS